MAVAIIISVFMSILMIGVGSYILYPIMGTIGDSAVYLDLPLEYKIKIDQQMAVIASLPISMVAVVIIWAFLRSSKNDQFRV